MKNKRISVWDLIPEKQYLITNEGDIFEDEYDYLESIASEYLGIKDNLEDWQNMMLEENTEWKTGEEILREVLGVKKGRQYETKRNKNN